MPDFNRQHHLYQNHLEHLWRSEVLGSIPAYSLSLWWKQWICVLNEYFPYQFRDSFRLMSQKTQVIIFLTGWNLLSFPIKKLYHLQGWYAGFIMLGRIKGFLVHCLSSWRCHCWFYTLKKLLEICPFYTPSRQKERENHRANGHMMAKLIFSRNYTQWLLFPFHFPVI